MGKKVLVIISTAEREKALVGVMYATNALKNKWLEDVKVFFFGPFEKLVAEDKEIQAIVAPLLEYQTPVACMFISDRDNVSASLHTLGYDVSYIGSEISAYIEEGYIPMVF